MKAYTIYALLMAAVRHIFQLSVFIFFEAVNCMRLKQLKHICIDFSLKCLKIQERSNKSFKKTRLCANTGQKNCNIFKLIKNPKRRYMYTFVLYTSTFESWVPVARYWPQGSRSNETFWLLTTDLFTRPSSELPFRTS